MTKGELNKNKDLLEAKQAELLRLVRNREAIEIERLPMLSMKCSTPQSESWRFATWIAIPVSCEMSGRHCSESKRAAPACACIAKTTSAPNAWRQCRGRRSASGARKSPTAARATTSTTSTSCWSTPHNSRSFRLASAARMAVG
jgi:hypothetical protein